MTPSRLRPIAASAAAMCLALICAGRVAAQPSLDFNNIILQWPTVRLQFTVKCNGRWTDAFQKQNFKVVEDGTEIGQFTLSCPEQHARCPIRVSLVLDGSGSMYGIKNQQTRIAAREFVNSMDGFDDMAAVLWFNDHDTLVQPMTSNLDSLRLAINGLPVFGTTAVWDATFDGITEVVKNTLPDDSCRAVIVLTDGIDNASSHTLDELIADATANGIRVYVVGIGNDVNGGALQRLAEETHGKYYHVDYVEQLVNIYQDIFMNVAGIDRCEIVYQSHCGDGVERTVELTLLNFCGGSDVKIRTYIPPSEGFPGIPTQIVIDSVRAVEDSTILVPVELRTPLGDEFFPPASITIRFDTTCLTSLGVVLNDTCLLKDVSIGTSPIPDGLIVKIENKRSLSETGTLFLLRFHTRERLMSGCCAISIDEWRTTGGCLKFFITTGAICVTAREPRIACDIDAPSAVRWNRSASRFDPDTIRVSGTFVNTGTRAAVGQIYTLEYDRDAFELLSPPDTIAGSVAGIPVGGLEIASWNLRARNRGIADTQTVCIRATFDNHPAVRCCARIACDAAGVALECSVGAPMVTIDTARDRYAPDPFSLAVSVFNAGGRTSDSVFVAIALPPGIVFSRLESDPSFVKRLVPAILAPNASGTARWSLTVEPSNIAHLADISAVAFTRDGDSTTCGLRLVVPAIDGPILQPACEVPGTLTPDPDHDVYLPDPFDVALGVPNVGNRPAYDVRATLLLPSWTQFATGETATKPFVPSTVDPQGPSGSPPRLVWRVRYLRRATVPTALPFTWIVTYRNGPVSAVDTIVVRCGMDVPPFTQRFACTLDAPAAVTLNAERTGYTGLPLHVTYRVRNISGRSVLLDRAEAGLTGAGARFDPLTPPVHNLGRVLNANDSLSVEWRIFVEGRADARDIGFDARVYDFEDNSVSCESVIAVPAVEAALACGLDPGADTVRIDALAGTAVPPAWTVTASLTNTHPGDLSDVYATLHLDAAASRLVRWDSAAPGNGATQTTPLLFAGQTRFFSWTLSARTDTALGQATPVGYSVSYGARTVSEIGGSCIGSVVLTPVSTPWPDFLCTLATGDTVRATDTGYEPPFVTVGLRVENVGGVRLDGLRAYVLQDARFRARGATALDVGSLDPGESAEGGALAFAFDITPSDADGIDTVRVVVVADGMEPRSCTHPIFIEAVRRPATVLACSAETDSVVFDAGSGTLRPDPFAVTVRIRNDGTAEATSCALSLAGSRYFVPADSAVVTLGSLAAGESVERTYFLHPRCKSTGATDTLAFQVASRGGYGDELRISACAALVVVPPCALPVLLASCDAPSRLGVDANGRAYSPDPFVSRAVVRNAGGMTAHGVRLSVQPSAGIVLAGGETAERDAGDLRPGDSAVVQWRLQALPRTDSATVPVCASIRADNASEQTCCLDVFVPPLPDLDAAFSCAAPDTLRRDATTGALVENPFLACAALENRSVRSIDSVRVEAAVVRGPAAIAPDSTSRLLAASLAPGAAEGTCWRVTVSDPLYAGTVSLRFAWYALGREPAFCFRDVAVQPVPRSTLQCGVLPSPADTLRYDPGADDYLGEASPDGSHRTVTVGVSARNDGGKVLDAVQATLDLPPGARWEDGEIPVRPLGSGVLAPGESGQTAFRIRFDRTPIALQEPIVGIVQSASTAPATCVATFVVAAAPYRAELRLPDDLVAVVGEEVDAPVAIDPAAGKDIRSFRILVRYDGRMLAFLDAGYPVGSPMIGWQGPTFTDASDATGGDARVLTARGASASPLMTSTERALLMLRFRVRLDAVSSLASARTELVFLDGRDGAGGTVCAFNPADDADAGAIRISTVDGAVTIAGDCLAPLRARAGFDLSVHPNPANPTAIVRYTLAGEQRVVVALFDAFGRRARVIVDDLRTAGAHEEMFDTGALASGVYRCVLVAGGAFESVPVAVQK